MNLNRGLCKKGKMRKDEGEFGTLEQRNKKAVTPTHANKIRNK